MKKNALYVLCFLAGAVIFNVIPSCNPDGTVNRETANLLCDSIRSAESLDIVSISEGAADSASAAYNAVADTIITGTFITKDVATLLFSLGADTIFTRLIIVPGTGSVSADYVAKKTIVVGRYRPDYIPTCPNYCCPAY